MFFVIKDVFLTLLYTVLFVLLTGGISFYVFKSTSSGSFSIKALISFALMIILTLVFSFLLFSSMRLRSYIKKAESVCITALTTTGKITKISDASEVGAFLSEEYPLLDGLISNIDIDKQLNKQKIDFSQANGVNEQVSLIVGSYFSQLKSSNNKYIWKQVLFLFLSIAIPWLIIMSDIQKNNRHAQRLRMRMMEYQ